MSERDKLEYLYFKYVNKKNDLEVQMAKLLTELETVKTVIDDLNRALDQTGHTLVFEHWVENTCNPEHEESKGVNDGRTD